MNTFSRFTGGIEAGPEQIAAGALDLREGQGSTEPFFVPQPQVSLQTFVLDQAIESEVAGQPKWETYTFTFSDSYLLGGGIMEASATTRLATCIRSLRTTAAASIEEDKTQEVDVKLRATSRFLKEEMPVTKDLSMPRQVILPSDTLTERLAAKLQKTNDPVMQAYDQVACRYGGQIDKEQLDRLKRDLVFAAKPDLVKAIYRTYVRMSRGLGQSLLRFMMQ